MKKKSKFEKPRKKVKLETKETPSSLSNKKREKFQLDPITYQTISQVIQFMNQYLEHNRPVETKKDSKKEELPEISFSLHTQKKSDITGQRIKTIQIYWKDKKQLKNFKIRKVKIKGLI